MMNFRRRVNRMKKSHVMIIGVLVGLTFILSACVPGPRVTGSPGISLSGDQVFVAYGSFVFGMNAATNNVDWHFPADSSNQVLFFAQPYVNDDFVYVGDVAKNFYKIDRDTGMSVWTFSGAKGYYIGQANEENGTVYAPANDGNLYAIDAEGNLQWKFETGHFLWSQPQIGENAIYLGSMDRSVYALSKDGDELWSTELAGAVVGAPTLSEDETMLFVASIGNDMVALDTSDGSVLWTFIAEDSVWGKSLLAEGTLYFADSSGYLYMLDPADGTQKQRLQLTSPIIGGLTALPDGIALVTEGGLIKVLEFDGSTRWEAGVSGNVFQMPVASDQYLMVAAVDGDSLVYAYNVTTGTQLWSTTPEK
jgi:outer membrane protein assembly factor BamB